MKQSGNQPIRQPTNQPTNQPKQNKFFIKYEFINQLINLNSNTSGVAKEQLIS